MVSSFAGPAQRPEKVDSRLFRRFCNTHWWIWALVFTLTLFSSGSAQAVNYTWTGAISTAYSNAGNWSPSGVPGAADTITISSGTIDLETLARTVTRLTMTGGAIQNGTLTLTSTTSASSWSNGSVGGTLNINSGVTMNFGGGTVAGTINNNGTFNWLSTGGNTAQNTGAIFNNNAAGIFNAQSNATWFNNGSGFQNFNNKGTFNRSGTGGTAFNTGINFNNTLTVNCTAGNLTLTDGTSTGTFNAVSPGLITFVGGIHTLTGGAKFTGTGSSQITSGTVSLNGNVVGGTSGGKLQLNGGTLTSVLAGGSITGTLTITGGFISGTVNIASGGTANWTGTGGAANVGQSTGAVFNVNAGGVFNAQSDAVWYNNGSGAQNFNMKGTLNKTGAATTSHFNPGINFNNTGTSNAASGTLNISNGTSTGTFSTAAGAATVFFTSNHTLTNDAAHPAGAAFTGAGVATITGGFVSVSGTVKGGNGGTLKLAGGTLSSPAAGGTITGTFTFESGLVDGKVSIGGTATWIGTSGIGQNTGSVLTVNVGGIFNAQSNANWFNNGSGAQNFNLKGTLNKTVAGSTSSFTSGVNFNNTGVANCTNGTLNISDGTSTGTFNTVLPGITNLNAGTHTLTGGAKFTGNGSTDIIGGFTNISGSIVGGQSGGRLQLLGGTIMTPVAGGTVTGTLTLAGGAISGTVNIASGGTANWVGTTNVGQNTGSIFNVNTGGVFNAQSTGSWFNNGSGTQNFNVKGTLNKTGAGTASTFEPGVNVNNTGTVNSVTGTLNLSNGTSTGTFNAASAAVLAFSNNTHTLTKDATNTAGAKFTGTGATIINFGTVVISNSIVGGTAGGTLKLAGGTLNGAPGTITGSVALAGGLVSGTLNIASGATATWTGVGGAANVGQTAGSIFDVNAGGIFNAQSDAVWYNSGSGVQTFNIKGTLNKTGAGTNSIFNPGINVNNTGVVNCTAGTLTLNDGTSSGTFSDTAPALIIFSSGAHTLTNGAKFTGTGSTNVTGTTITINGTIVGGTSGGTLNLAGGTLTTPAAGGTVTGVLTLSNGLVGGTINIPSGAVVHFGSGGSGGTIGANTNSIFNVKAGAIFNAAAGSQWYNNGTGGSQSFNMAGNMNLGGTGDVTFGIKFIESSTSLLNVRIASDSAFDRLILNGPSFTLTGTLDVGLLSGFVPAPGTNFQVILFNGTRTGTFSFVSSPYTATYNPNDVTLTTPATASLYVKVNPQAFNEASPNGTVVGTVTRTGSTAAALAVSLANTLPSRLTVPASVNIPVGQSSANFAVTVLNNALLDGNATATITGTASGFTAGSTRVNIIDDDVPVLTINVTPSPFVESAANGTVSGTVTRNTATTTAQTVVVSSSNVNKAKVSTTALPTPAASVSVTIPVGATSAPFRVHAIDNAVKDGNVNVVFTATASGFTSGTKTVTVTDDDNGSLTLTILGASSFAENASVGGAAATTARVALQAVSATPVTVTVTSSNANKVTFAGATVNNGVNPPTASATVTIPANTLNTTFNVLAVNNQLVDGNFNVTITVQAPTYIQDSEVVTVTDNDSTVLTLVVDPNTFAENAGTNAATATITRNTTNNAAALSVTVVSSNANKVTFAGATVNNTVTPPTASVVVSIPAGAASLNLAVRAVNNALLDGNFAVGLTASATGFLSSSAGVTVTDDEASIMRVIPGASSTPVSLSNGEAVAASDYVSLLFTGTLDGETAADASRYTVFINGFPAVVESASYSTATNKVTLDLGAGALEAGDDVRVAWKDLEDSKGRILNSQTALVAR